MVKLVVDADTCIFAGECIYNHPEYFAWDENDRVMVIKPDVVTPDDERHAKQAIDLCPARAISVETESTPEPAEEQS